MSDSSNTRRAVAEIRTGENQLAGARIGNRSIHQFWYLISPYFRHVLLAPHRRPDSDQVTWSWHESVDARPPTAPELAEVRRRLTDANRALADDSADLGSAEGGAQSLDAQVRRNLQEMIATLAAKSDQALGGHVCRTPTGLMLHSWSASTPSAPDYPDSRQGGISGTVWLDGQTAAGVKVVLQNKQGANLEHATSGRTGAFGFQNVAPGQYHVRVAGRDDFPAEGLAVTVGREAVDGLELRGGSRDPAVVRGASSAAALSGSKRRWG
ncbi:MAG: carboxypeptidase-like regulatory domain-containing protein, partial [Lacunisphaera sp.]|nr:carboxypeptidase-like regulatory domain-containing protein [Lacunisphaera sp.]